MFSCNTCNVDLTENNWATSRRVRNHKLCNSCKSKSNAKTNPNNNPKNNPNRLYINGKYISSKDPRYSLFKPGKHWLSEGDILTSTKTLSSSPEGYVYILIHPKNIGWVKIGMTEDLDKRLSQFQTACPTRSFKYAHTKHFDNRRTAEAKAHVLAQKVATIRNNEWFEMSVEQAITILDNLDEQHRTVIKADTHEKEDNLQGCLF